MAAPSTILDLPVELLLLTFQYLDVNSFLNLTSTCKALHKPEFSQDSAYWSTLVRTSFRVPNQPAVEHHGKRWQKLYKRLLTQSRIYTWGNNEKACLGHSYELPATMQNIVRPGSRRYSMLRRKHVPWPEKMRRVEDLGVISDLQCGGWSTTLLTAKGALYTVGVIDGLHFDHRQGHAQKLMMEPMPLHYPPGFPHPYDRYEPSVAVQQFSSGRSHVLALSDSGRIWSWQNIEHAGLHVKFLLHDTVENGRGYGRGTVKKVLAGWSKSAALIEGIGIVLWEPLQREPDETAIEDAALVFESAVVPHTSYSEPRRQRGRLDTFSSSNPVIDIGEVLNFVVLEHIVVFNTHLGKIFVSQIYWNGRGQKLGDPVELPLPVSDFVTDVQGSYQSFGVFTRSGRVLICKQERALKQIQGQLAEELFTRIPALQHKNVIQLAFGDYHFHALHSPGYITSYGTEPQHCGALGLGCHAERRLRGLRSQAVGGDGRLIAHAYTEGRRVWFEREKRAWIQFLTSGAVDPGEAMERVRMAIGSPNEGCQGEVSEWVEQQARDWESKFGLEDEDDDGLGAYFVLSVAAAGWHSGALVLENSDLVEKLKRACEIPDERAVTPQLTPEAAPIVEAAERSDQPSITAWLVHQAVSTGADWARWFLGMPPYDANTLQAAQAELSGATSNMELFRRGMHPINYGASPRVGYMYTWAKDHFPRLRLSDGTEMPGTVAFDEWRYPRPEWELDIAL
jgi:SCF-associated factor 1